MLPVALAVLLLILTVSPRTANLACVSQEAPPSHAGTLQSCWKGAEIVNRDAARRKPPELSQKFEGAKVDRTAVVIKLCIDPAGRVVRTLVLRSSGNREIDQFYRDAFSKWTLKPVLKAGRPAESVATVAVSWNSA